MAAPTIYRSTDASAPVLSGSVGALVSVLDACLVAGYGAKPGAGWSKPFTGANAAAFRPGAGPRHFLNVDDSGSSAAVGKEAIVAGYETMSALATGTQVFPAAANSAALRKSSTADAVARAWVLIADDRTFYLFVQTGDTAGVHFTGGFGEFYSFLSTSDAARTILLHRPVNSATGAADPLSTVASTAAALAGHVVPRGYPGTGAPVLLNKHVDFVKNGSSASAGQGVIPFPNPEDGGVYIGPFWLLDPLTAPAQNLRGRLRGLVNQYHPFAAWAVDDTFSGTADYAGRNFLVLGRYSGNGVIVVETTAWETNS